MNIEGQMKKGLTAAFLFENISDFGHHHVRGDCVLGPELLPGVPEHGDSGDEQ